MPNTRKFISSLTSLTDRIATPVNYFSGVKPMGMNRVTNLLFFVRDSREQLYRSRREAPPHHRFVLITNLKGEGTISIDKQLFRMRPGQCVLVHPYQFHHYLDIAAETISWVFMTFELTGDGKLEEFRNRPLKMSDENIEIYIQVLKSYLDLQEGQFRGESGNMVLLRASLLLEELRLKAFREVVQHVLPLQATAPGASLMQRINSILFEHDLDEVSVAFLADNLNISESHLRARFREISGLSLGLYIQNFRINKALSLIRDTKMSISGIAEICGYSSLASFSRSFKNIMGRSPGAFR